MHRVGFDFTNLPVGGTRPLKSVGRRKDSMDGGKEEQGKEGGK